MVGRLVSRSSDARVEGLPHRLLALLSIWREPRTALESPAETANEVRVAQGGGGPPGQTLCLSLSQAAGLGRQ